MSTVLRLKQKHYESHLIGLLTFLTLGDDVILSS